LYQGTNFIRAEQASACVERTKGHSSLPQASAQLLLSERSALKNEGF